MSYCYFTNVSQRTCGLTATLARRHFARIRYDGSYRLYERLPNLTHSLRSAIVPVCDEGWCLCFIVCSGVLFRSFALPLSLPFASHLPHGSTGSSWVANTVSSCVPLTASHQLLLLFFRLFFVLGYWSHIHTLTHVIPIT